MKGGGGLVSLGRNKGSVLEIQGCERGVRSLERIHKLGPEGAFPSGTDGRRQLDRSLGPCSECGSFSFTVLFLRS